MRIIAGEFRGRKLLPPASDATRPITDRVKQSLFDILTPLLDGAVVYDCFAGTGSLGLECVSRGAAMVTCLELDRGAHGLLKQNIEALGVAARCRAVNADAFRWVATAPMPDPRVSLVFLDPPYRYVAQRPSELLKLVDDLRSRHLAADATVVFRHDAADRLALPGLAGYDERTYGGMTLEFLRPT